jgi:hypothetical protein
LTRLSISSDQLFLLGVDADHGVAVGEELRSEAVEIPELSATLGMLFLLPRPYEGAVALRGVGAAEIVNRG